MMRSSPVVGAAAGACFWLLSSSLLLLFNCPHPHHSHYYVDAFVLPSSPQEAGKTSTHQRTSPFSTQASSTSSTTMEESSSSTTGASLSARPKESKSNIWADFDYEQQWYPVSWICDLRHAEPTKVTLFDVDYVVAVDKSRGKDDTNVKITAALRDRCPHRSAALSEGRITTSGAIQCAYHGWSFNGTTGNCLEIPQATTTAASSAASATSFSSRTCATAVPARAHQGMLWLWPGPVRQSATDYPLPPSIPEMSDDATNYKKIRVVRDFPHVDWTLLVSNILDPDHGLFAHQASPFDWYSASPSNPLTVHETFGNNGKDGGGSNGGWTMFSSVPAVEKLLHVDKEKRKAAEKEMSSSSSSKRTTKTPKDATQKQQYLATSTFYAPTTVALCRRPAATDSSDGTVVANMTASPAFVTAFWVCPVGTGKSRFFSCACSRVLPFPLPRWFLHYNLNNFLDQDTVLVASQQPGTLTAEALGQGRSTSSILIDMLTNATTTTSTHERSKASSSSSSSSQQPPLYAYASPTDKAVRLLDQFWDATTARAPNRRQRLQEMLFAGQLRHTDAHGQRRVILDRQAQHLDICPDSQDAVRNFKRLRSIGSVVSLWLLLLAPLSSLSLSVPTMASLNQASVGSAGAGAGGVGVNVVAALVLRAAGATMKIQPRYRFLLLVVSSLIAWLSHTLQRGFYYNYPEWKRNRDLKNIPAKTWMDANSS